MCVPDAGCRWMCGKPPGKPEQICWKQETGAQKSWSESDQGNMGNSPVTPSPQVQTQRFLRPKRSTLLFIINMQPCSQEHHRRYSDNYEVLVHTTAIAITT